MRGCEGGQAKEAHEKEGDSVQGGEAAQSKDIHDVEELGAKTGESEHEAQSKGDGIGVDADKQNSNSEGKGSGQADSMTKARDANNSLCGDNEFSEVEDGRLKSRDCQEPSEERFEITSKYDEQQALWFKVYVSGKHFLPECSGRDLDNLWWQIIEFPFMPQYEDGTGLQPDAYRRMMLQNIKEELNRRDDGKRQKREGRGQKRKG